MQRDETISSRPCNSHPIEPGLKSMPTLKPMLFPLGCVTCVHFSANLNQYCYLLCQSLHFATSLVMEGKDVFPVLKEIPNLRKQVGGRV